jgi:hypothetical protein
MPRKLRNPKARRAAVPRGVLDLLATGELPPVGVSGRVHAFRLLKSSEQLRAAWLELRDAGYELPWAEGQFGG